MKTTTRWLIALLAGALLAACGGGLLGNQGRIRLVNATTGLGALDLLIGGSAAITGVATATASDYVLRKPDTYQLDLRQTGNAATLLTTSTALVADKHQTLVAYNTGGTVAATILDDEEGDPGRNQAKFRVFNTATADADKVDVYLITAACSTLGSSAAAPTATSVSGLQSAYTQLSSSATAYHLCVTGAGDKNDVRLEIPSFVLSEKRIVTVILTRATGGYLMNAIVLDQQGAATPVLNASARARVATSVPTAVDVTVNTVLIASGLSSGNAIPYVLVPAGPVTLKVNGNDVAPATPLNAGPGADFTVLLTGTTPTATLLADDNTPSSSIANPVKLRLVNGLNGVSSTGTATLTLNNIVVNSGVGPGQASGYAQVASSAGLARLEARIGTLTLYLDPTATLASGSVYTLFLLGDGTAPAPPNRGILVPDR
jgi:hypothetical protein